jgi:hypothetical protein
MSTERVIKKPAVKEFDEPFESANRALKRFKKNAAWKDVIPFLIKWIDDNQPDDTNYCLDLWIKTRRPYRRK